MAYTLINTSIITSDLKKPVLKEKSVIIEAGTITNVASNSLDSKEIGKFDCKGHYLIPLMINASADLTHNIDIPYDLNTEYIESKKLFKKNKYLKLAKNNAYNEIISGTSTVKSFEGNTNINKKLRIGINNHTIIGPKILYSLDIRFDNTNPNSYFISTKEDIKKLENNLMNIGPTFFDINLDNSNVELVNSLFDLALKHSIKVCYRFSNRSILKDIKLDNTLLDGDIIDEDIKLFERKKVAFISNLTSSKNKDLRKETLILLKKNNIDIALGNMAGINNSHTSFVDEIIEVKNILNLTNQEALNMATLGNAKILGIDMDNGSIAPGMLANIAVYKNNPLDDLNILKEKPLVMILKGQFKQDKDLELK